jgi:hypothetical protein
VQTCNDLIVLKSGKNRIKWEKKQLNLSQKNTYDVALVSINFMVLFMHSFMLAICCSSCKNDYSFQFSNVGSYVVVRSKASFEPSSHSLLLLLFCVFGAKTYWLRSDLFRCYHFEYNLILICWRCPNTGMRIKVPFQTPE